MKHLAALLLALSLFTSFASAAEIAGVVVDEAGNPIAGAKVDVWTWYTGNEATTDKEGKFALKGLDDNDPVELRITKDGFSPYYNENENTGNTDSRYTLTNKTFFEGVVLSPDGKPVPNATITAKAPEKRNKRVHIGSVQTATRSDKEGKYKLYCWPDNYEFRIRVPKVGVLRTADNTVGENEGKTQDLHLEPPITLKVVAQDSESGTPVEGVRISGARESGGSGVTSKEGLAEIPDLLPGQVSLNVRARGFCRWWIHDQKKEEVVYYTKFPLHNNTVEVNVARDMDAIHLDLEKGVTVRGIVQDPDGNPVASATVGPVTGGDFITQDSRYNVVTRKDGSFATTLPASLEHQYALVAIDGTAEFKAPRKWASGHSEPMQTNPGQEINNIVIKLTKGGSVKGKLTNSSGDPAGGKSVRAMPANGFGTHVFAVRAKTDKEGNFELKNVAPGDQLIQCEPFWSELANFKPEQSVQVTVESDAAVEGVELQLRPGD
ncbi:MAG TPA: carboxypeptidase-like regulatory domain-containing protein [Tepidisphaeraceae bacterium]|jgi:hypothetical protein